MLRWRLTATSSSCDDVAEVLSALRFLLSELPELPLGEDEEDDSGGLMEKTDNPGGKLGDALVAAGAVKAD